MNIVYSTPILCAFASRGNRKYWQGQVLKTGPETYFTRSEYWQETKDGEGEHQFSVPVEVSIKNRGRSNETRPLDQAISEINSDAKKKMDRGYSSGTPDSRDIVLPMLAYKYTDRSHNVTWPCYAQPKFNGTRCVSDGHRMWTRTGQLYLQDCVKHLLPFNTDGVITDGELILPPEYHFQHTLTASKKYREELSHKLLYRIYDTIAVEKSFSDRYENAKEIVAEAKNDNIILSPIYKLNTEEELFALHATLTSQGWEGTMIRSEGRGYKIANRDVQLLKLKDFQDAEFLVIDVVEGEGKFKSCAVLVCQTSEGKTFKATPAVTIEQKIALWNNRENIIGTTWTIKYQELSKDNIPIFPVAVAERWE